MSESLFKVGDKIRRSNWGARAHVVITAVGKERFLGLLHSTEGRIENEDSWSQVDGQWGWEPYVDPPKRYVVEIREPKAGEKYIAPGGFVTTATLNFSHDEHPVIVEEL